MDHKYFKETGCWFQGTYFINTSKKPGVDSRERIYFNETRFWFQGTYLLQRNRVLIPGIVFTSTKPGIDSRDHIYFNETGYWFQESYLLQRNRVSIPGIVFTSTKPGVDSRDHFTPTKPGIDSRDCIYFNETGYWFQGSKWCKKFQSQGEKEDGRFCKQFLFLYNFINVSGLRRIIYGNL